MCITKYNFVYTDNLIFSVFAFFRTKSAQFNYAAWFLKLLQNCHHTVIVNVEQMMRHMGNNVNCM